MTRLIVSLVLAKILHVMVVVLVALNLKLLVMLLNVLVVVVILTVIMVAHKLLPILQLRPLSIAALKPQMRPAFQLLTSITAPG